MDAHTLPYTGSFQIDDAPQDSRRQACASCLSLPYRPPSQLLNQLLIILGLDILSLIV